MFGLKHIAMRANIEQVAFYLSATFKTLRAVPCCVAVHMRYGGTVAYQRM